MDDEKKQTDPSEATGTGANKPESSGGEGASEPGEGAGAEAPKGETVNRHKHEREISKRDDRIKELVAENAKLKGQNEDVAALAKRLDDIEANAKAEKVEASLKAAGCHNVKAAIACLDDYDGDVQELKKAAPYLFSSSDASKSTGGNQKGKPGDGDEDEKLDRAFGLK